MEIRRYDGGRVILTLSFVLGLFLQRERHNDATTMIAAITTIPVHNLCHMKPAPPS
jgi:hypothetical protein